MIIFRNIWEFFVIEEVYLGFIDDIFFVVCVFIFIVFSVLFGFVVKRIYVVLYVFKEIYVVVYVNIFVFIK